jgi:hypothetical protein
MPKFIALGSLRFSHVSRLQWNHAKQLWHS